MARQLKARTPRLDAAAEANAGGRLLAREGVDADRLSRELRTFELRTTCVPARRAHAAPARRTLRRPFSRCAHAVLPRSYDAEVAPEARTVDEYLAQEQNRITAEAIAARAHKPLFAPLIEITPLTALCLIAGGAARLGG